jgi:hypothetical protein
MVMAGSLSFIPTGLSDTFWNALNRMVENFMLPSGYVKIAIENGPFVVDFPIKDGDLP